jgi:spectinomycin phosphotransferase
MLREKPNLSDAAIVRCLEREYGLSIERVVFLPIGYDADASVYRVHTYDSAVSFLKLTRNPKVLPTIRIPEALIDRGITNVVAAFRTLRGTLWGRLDSYAVVLYPFLDGENAMERGMSDHEWTMFGRTLHAIHRSGIAPEFAADVPTEGFAGPMIDLVRSMEEEIRRTRCTLPVQRELARFWQENAAMIRRLADRTEQLGSVLRTETFDTVLCHGDIHAANIVLDRHGTPYIVDWDTPRIAPRERDLLFIIGSVIARPVTPDEEDSFFRGYGDIEINWRALTFYRYERVLEELYEGARSVFFNLRASEALRESDAQVTMDLFQPGSLIQSAVEADERLGLIPDRIRWRQSWRFGA